MGGVKPLALDVGGQNGCIWILRYYSCSVIITFYHGFLSWILITDFYHERAVNPHL